MRSSSPLLAAAAAVLAFAAPAFAAAKPVDLGTGTGAEVAVDPSGAAHIAFWSAPENSVVYCRVPRRARACDVRTLLPIESEPNDWRLYRRADGVLTVLQTEKDADGERDQTGARLFVSVSTDNGATFTPPSALATGIDESYAVGLSPDGQGVLLLQTDLDSVLLRRAPFTGPDPRVTLVDDTAGTTSAAAVAPMADGRLMMIHSTIDDITSWAVSNGGDPLDPASWATRGILGTSRGQALTTGARGTYMLEHTGLAYQLIDRRSPTSLREFDTKRMRWLGRRDVFADSESNGGARVRQDASGRLHAVVATNDYAGLGCVMYARTGAKRSQWFGRTTVLFFTRSRSAMPNYATAAAAPDGRGVATWNDATGHVWMTPLVQAKGKPRPASERRNCGRKP